MNPLTLFPRLLLNTSLFRSIIPRTLFQSLLFTAFWYSLIILLITSLLSFLILPPFHGFLTSSLDHLESTFPPHVSATLDPETGLSLSGTDSLMITNPNSDFFPTSHLLIIEASASARTLADLNTLVLINSSATSIITPDADVSFDLPHSDLPQTITLSKTSLSQNLPHILTYLDTLYNLRFPLTAVMLIIFYLLSRSLYLLLYTLINRSLGWLLGRPLSFTNYLKISLHTIVYAEILYTLQFLLFQGKLNLFPLAFLGLNLIATLSLPKIPRLILKNK